MLRFQSRKWHLLIKHKWLSNKKNVEMEINRTKSLFQSHDSMSTVIQRWSFDVVPTLKYGCTTSWPILQPYFNVDRTFLKTFLCMCAKLHFLFSGSYRWLCQGGSYYFHESFRYIFLAVIFLSLWAKKFVHF